MASEWAARSLLEDYRVDPGRIRLAPFGPSVVSSSPPEGPRPGTPLRILFVARDWTRKGGDLALASVERLRDEGVSCDLTVVGEGPDLPAWVHRVGRVRREEMGTLYAAHDVLLETARANAGGVTTSKAHSNESRTRFMATDLEQQSMTPYANRREGQRAGAGAATIAATISPTEY